MKKLILCIVVLCIITVVSCDRINSDEDTIDTIITDNGVNQLDEVLDKLKSTHWISEDGEEFYFNEDGTEFLSSSNIPWYAFRGDQFCKVSFMKGGKKVYEARNISFSIEGKTLTLIEDEEIIQEFTKIELCN